MTDTTRDLIQRLADFLEEITEELVIPEYAHTEEERSNAALALVAEARAFLAQPNPKGPTVMEIIALADEIEAEGLGQVDLVRRALARWGSALPTPQP